MGKSLNSDSARAGSLKQQKKSVETCNAGRTGAHPGAHPYRRARNRMAHQVERSRGLKPRSPPIDP